MSFVCRGHTQGHFPVEGAVWKCCLGHWLVRTTSLKFLSAQVSGLGTDPAYF